jgi:hypothetical protein
MSYALTISKKHNFLHAKVTGQNSEENIKQYLGEVVKKCKDAKCRRLLIEEHLAGPRLDTMSVFDIASEGSVSSRGLFTAIAYVDISAEGGLMDFAETVAINRGLPLRSFRTVIEAEKWLMVQK